MEAYEGALSGHDLARTLPFGAWVRGEAVVEHGRVEPRRVIGRLTGLVYAPVLTRTGRRHELCVEVRQAWFGGRAFVPVDYAYLMGRYDGELPERLPNRRNEDE